MASVSREPQYTITIRNTHGEAYREECLGYLRSRDAAKKYCKIILLTLGAAYLGWCGEGIIRGVNTNKDAPLPELARAFGIVTLIGAGICTVVCLATIAMTCLRAHVEGRARNYEAILTVASE